MQDGLVALLLFLGGSLTGSLLNWCIYNLGWFQRPPVSPWGPRSPEALPRRWSDRIPVLGWLGLRRETPVHGRRFWLRPMLIELAMGLFAVAFWNWQLAGGMVGGRAPVEESAAQLWFSAHYLLVALLVIATFIDFDEQTIPDWVTVPGTLCGLAFAVAMPGFRLPELVGRDLGVAWQSVHFATPFDALSVPWAWDGRGLALAVAVILLWAFALAPKITTLRWGFWRGVRLMFASLLRPARRRPCSIRIRQRRPFAVTWLLLLLAIGLTAMTVVVYGGAGERWISLFSSLAGMAIGGGSIWAVRVVASQAMGQEAMGFGDVTLMAMIGTFVGWQASLLSFGLAPFAALVIAVSQFALSRRHDLAFGPYLALATVLVLVGWSRLWNDYARRELFASPGLLLGVLLAALVLMALMLLGLGWMRGGTVDDE